MQPNPLGPEADTLHCTISRRNLCWLLNKEPICTVSGSLLLSAFKGCRHGTDATFVDEASGSLAATIVTSFCFIVLGANLF